MVKEDVDYCRMSNLKSGSIDDDPRIRAVDCDHMSTVVLQKKGCPGPVRSLRAIEIGYTRVKLSWQPPVDDGGFPVTGYRVYNVRGRPMSGETIDTEYLFDGLKEGTQHYFVVALNRFGEGNPQQLTISTKRSTSPQQPQKFEGSLDQESNTVRLEWSPPDDDGGSPLLSYHIEYCNMSDGEWKEAERVAPDLTQWTRKYDDGSFVYNFRICAENEKGCGERAELKNPIQFHCTGNGKDLHSNKSKRRVKSVSRMDNKEKAYEENFKTFRQYIESCVKVKDLIAFFELFTMEQQQQLRHMHRTDPKEAIRQALDYIQQMTGVSDKYQNLIRALTDAEYEKVVGILEGQLIPDNDKNRMKIKDSYQHIYKMLSTGDVIAHLYRRKVLNVLDMEEIRVAEQNYGRSDAATELLFMLPRRDRDWFEKFLEALMECQQTDLAALIDKDLSERIQPRKTHDNLDLDLDMRSTRSVVSNSSDSTVSDNIESSLDEDFTLKNMGDAVNLKSAMLNRKAVQNGSDIDDQHNEPLTASLLVVETVHRVLIHSQSFKESQKIKDKNQLLNIIYDCHTRLDDLLDDTHTSRWKK